MKNRLKICLISLFLSLASYAGAMDSVPSSQQNQALICQWNSCKQSFNNTQQFYDHVNSHVKGSTRCQYAWCSYVTTKQSDLIDHVKKHTGEKLKCPYTGCNHSTITNHSLKTHIKTEHTGEGAFKCFNPGCNYAVNTSGNLDKHTRMVHGGYKCLHRSCNHVTQYYSSFNEHKKIHTGEKIYRYPHTSNNYVTTQNINPANHTRYITHFIPANTTTIYSSMIPTSQQTVAIQNLAALQNQIRIQQILDEIAFIKKIETAKILLDFAKNPRHSRPSDTLEKEFYSEKKRKLNQ